MPNLNEFLSKLNNNLIITEPKLETIDGTRPCSKCDLNVDGAHWNEDKLLLSWVCNSGHENSIQVG